MTSANQMSLFPEKKVLVFAFRGNISERVLNEIFLPGVVKKLINGVEDIHDLALEIGTQNYAYVLGMGMYARKSEMHLRIETKCTNRFRGRVTEVRVIPVHPFILPDDVYKYGSNIGRSYCNKVSYEIMRMLIAKELPIKYTFIHIPKNFDAKLASNTISKSIRGLI